MRSNALSGRECSVFCFILIDKLFVSKYHSTKPVFSEIVFWSSFIACPIFSMMYHQHTSFTYKMKSSGPRTEPGGTPYLTGRLLDKHSFS
jgi:hypothetical protein